MLVSKDGHGQCSCEQHMEHGGTERGPAEFRGELLREQSADR